MATRKKVLKILGIAVIVLIVALILFIAINLTGTFGEDQYFANPETGAANIVKQAYANFYTIRNIIVIFKQNHNSIIPEDITHMGLEPNQIQFIPSKVQMSDFIISFNQIKYTGTKNYKVTLYALCTGDGKIPMPYFNIFDSNYAITGSKDTICYLTLTPNK